MLKFIIGFIVFCFIAFSFTELIRYFKIKGKYIFYAFLMISFILILLREKELLGMLLIFSACCYSWNEQIKKH